MYHWLSYYFIRKQTANGRKTFIARSSMSRENMTPYYQITLLLTLQVKTDILTYLPVKQNKNLLLPRMPKKNNEIVPRHINTVTFATFLRTGMYLCGRQIVSSFFWKKSFPGTLWRCATFKNEKSNSWTIKFCRINIFR